VLALMLALPATAKAMTLVSYSESGGVAARHVALEVTAGARASVTANNRPRVWQLHTSTLHHLRRLLVKARFDRVHPPPSRCADCIVHVVRHRGQRVSYDDSQAPHVPRSVRAAVAELARIARGGR